MFNIPSFFGFRAGTGLILDNYPNASRAYSLRKLRTAYTGSAIQVRRSSDNTTSNIGFLSNGELDTTALLSFVGNGVLDNGFITDWYDQSGSAGSNNATQSIALNQPQIVSGGALINLGTKPSIDLLALSRLDFNGIDTINFTVLYVSKVNTSNVTNVLLANASSGSRGLGDNSPASGSPFAFVGIIDSTLNNNSLTNSIPTYQLVYANRRNTTQAVGQINGSNNAYNNSVASTSAIYSIISGYGSGVNYLGKVQEIIIYANDQSANRVGLETNINNFYSIF